MSPLVRTANLRTANLRTDAAMEDATRRLRPRIPNHGAPSQGMMM
ncbi:MAG: hypothetical protein ABW188_11025 [Rhodococcus fascians]|nr:MULTISPECIES: hypothetical protein [unclassified Rhodococcus (in: high G+C Gram-positive bacteria)]